MKTSMVWFLRLVFMLGVAYLSSLPWYKVTAGEVGGFIIGIVVGLLVGLVLGINITLKHVRATPAALGRDSGLDG